MLSLHPDLSLPVTRKETFFFDRHFERGPDWYDRQFDPLRRAFPRGEIGPSYFDSPLAMERLAACRHLKVIVGLRNPITRAFSLFRHHRSRGRVPPGFFEAVERMPEILSSGIYARWFPQWEKRIEGSRIFCMIDDDVASDPRSVLGAICGFLGIDTLSLPETAWQRVNRSTEPPFPAVARVASLVATWMRAHGYDHAVETIKRLGGTRIYGRAESRAARMDEDVFAFLLQYHEPDIRFVEGLTGRCLDHWRRPDPDV